MNIDKFRNPERLDIRLVDNGFVLDISTTDNFNTYHTIQLVFTKENITDMLDLIEEIYTVGN